MFLVLDAETGEHEFSLKPMNCPSHHVYYASKTHSYRELPIRFTTYDVLHRNELSGTLSGLTRVRQFQQDDCHIYLRDDQIASEVKRLTSFILAYYESFGLKAALKFATRPAQRIGDDAMWDRAEGALRAALEATGLPYELNAGRRRVLRPEDRLRRRGFARPQVAARHDPARLRGCRSASASSTSARTTRRTGPSSSTAPSTARSSGSSRS